MNCARCNTYGVWMVKLELFYSTPAQSEYLCLDCLKLEMDLEI